MHFSNRRCRSSSENLRYLPALFSEKYHPISSDIYYVRLRPFIPFALVSLASTLGAQNVSVVLSSSSGTPGGTANLSVSFSTSNGAQPAAFEFTVGFSSSSITSASASAGVAASTAGKSIDCSNGTGSLICVVYGLNDNVVSPGTIANVTLQIASTASGTIPISLSGISISDPSGNAISASGSGGNITLSASAAPVLQLTGLICFPSTITAPGSANCTLAISGPAPTGGASVALSSSSPIVSVPPNVQVGAGQTLATFVASASVTISMVNVTLTAWLSGSTYTSGLVVSPLQVLQVTSLICTPLTLTGPAMPNCTVTISAVAPPQGVVVTLSSNNSLVTVPPSVTVAPGESEASFRALVGAASNAVSVTLAAGGLSGNPATTQLTLSPQQLQVTSLSCTPPTLTGPATATCTVTVSSAAPGGGVTVSLSSNNVSVTVPASVMLAPGQTSVTFTASAAAVSSTTVVILTAGLNGSAVTASVNVQAPPAQTLNMSCSPATVTAPGNSTCTLTISGMAPMGGTMLSLSSNNPTVTVPPSATVSAGQTSITFSAVVAAISDSESALITAQGSNNILASFGLDLVPGVVIDSIANSASYNTNVVCSPGSLASIFGSGFTSGASESASAVPFPKKLAEVEVAVGGVAAPLLYASNQLINFQCPDQNLSTPVTITVTGASGHTATSRIPWEKASPGIFSTNMSGHGQGVVFVAGTSLIAGPEGPGSRPAHPGDSIEIFATGLGSAPPTRLRSLESSMRTTLPVSIAIGSEQLQPAAATPAAFLDGLWHITVSLPSDVQTGGAVPLQLNVTLSDGTIVSSNVVTIAIQYASASSLSDN